MSSDHSAPAPRRVLVVGPMNEGAMALSIVRGFEELGCDVATYPYARFSERVGQVPVRGRYQIAMHAHRLARPVESALIVQHVRRLRPALVFYLKCDDLHALVYRAVAHAAPRARQAAFHPDDPFNTGRGIFVRTGGPSDPRAVDQMRGVDAFFVWSHALVEKARRAGARRPLYLPFACDPELHPRPPTESIPRALTAAVTFIGNWDPEREKWLAAIARTDLDLAVWGTVDWLRRCKDQAIRARYRGRTLFAHEMALASRGSAINLNVLRRQNKGATNMRTFEIPCSGGFLLHERSAEAAAIFAPGVAMDDFGSPAELADKVRYWLARPAERESVADAGFAIARRHTYREWAAAVLDAFGL